MKKTIWTVAILLCAGAMLFSAVQILLPLQEYGKAGGEYAALRQQRTPGDASQDGDADAAADSSRALSAINPDYAGWLQIPGTAVDYPVVRGPDNAKYLHTTFVGTENPVGAIFLDCALTAGFDAEHAILFGHNVPDGSMFGGLYHYLDREYLEQNPTIIITTAEGETLAYTIFSARKSNVLDAAYRLDFPQAKDFAAFAGVLGAPEGTEHLLTLSTCTSGGGRDERVLVHAARTA